MTTGSERSDLTSYIEAEGRGELVDLNHPHLSRLDPRLQRTVIGQVIPRLKALNRALIDCETLHLGLRDPAFSPDSPVQRTTINEEHGNTLLRLLASGSAEERHAFYESLVHQGIGLDELFEGLIAPAARTLGDCWSADTLSFSEVSAACSGLQADIIWLAGRFGQDDLAAARDSSARRILVFAFPGDRHVLGASMLAETFRQEGWNVTAAKPAGIEEAVVLARNIAYDVIAISIACTDFLEDAAAAIRRLRVESRNRNVGIMAGGPAIADKSAAVRIGADATSFTGQEAVFQASILADEKSATIFAKDWMPAL